MLFYFVLFCFFIHGIFEALSWMSYDLRRTAFHNFYDHIDRKDARLQVVIMKVQDRKTYCYCILQRADTCSPFGPWRDTFLVFVWLSRGNLWRIARILIYRLMCKINNHNRQICLWGDKWNTPTKQPMGRFILGCHGTCTTLLSFKGSPKMLRAELGGPKRWDISYGIQSVRCSLYGHVGVHQRTLFSGAGTISQYTIIMGPDQS